MSDARSAILSRVRSVPHVEAPVALPAYRQVGERDRFAIVELFCQRVAEYGAEVMHAKEQILRDAIGEVCRGRFAVPAGWPDELRPPGVSFVTDDGLMAADLDQIDGALTGCTLAVAETGTIALSSRELDGHRATTLVPDRHVCVVGAGQVVETVPEAMQRLAELVRRDRRPITLISGPSATSDIELRRVEGVHGPRELTVIVYE